LCSKKTPKNTFIIDLICPNLASSQTGCPLTQNSAVREERKKKELHLNRYKYQFTV